MVLYMTLVTIGLAVALILVALSAMGLESTNSEITDLALGGEAMELTSTCSSPMVSAATVLATRGFEAMGVDSIFSQVVGLVLGILQSKSISHQ